MTDDELEEEWFEFVDAHPELRPAHRSADGGGLVPLCSECELDAMPGRALCEVHFPNRQCTGENGQGERCGSYARPGEATCRWHDPAVVVARLEKRLADALRYRDGLESEIAWLRGRLGVS